MEYPDFLRHVANKIISPTNLDAKRLDEARKLLAEAETKYKFSSYGGNPKKLIDYLQSPEFIELVMILGVDLSKKLVTLIRDSYQDEEMKQVANKIMEELDGYSDIEESKAMKNRTFL
ncbi:hypothetical protein [Sulfuracidifex metallicus]|uniref:Uncharacterized protein n=1 Tax=Sulfuracidifex metallicus DSM 6482 = JCM 9184 TaxID=523847 RepID=A0A6A9QIB6_SULME|nr:hypothetical protein [Sulfuracidifex metallicus]MUN27970.1 hypothetical protein [Sulfuracidifex metallicus DSM 6482 = JCM 9184]WOE51482.1 hypothetical protein RQ359_000775 [Sulfuracidifex metallicus DSM 6482 = JCM 9184]